MTQDEINKLITNFVGGWEYHEEDVCPHGEILSGGVWEKKLEYDSEWYFELAFHSSFDWLMSVVEKIEQDEKFATMMYVNKWDNRGRYVFSVFRELDENKNMRNMFIEIATDSKIKSVLLGVLEFIKLKNEDLIPKTQEEFNHNYQEYQKRKLALQYPDQ